MQSLMIFELTIKLLVMKLNYDQLKQGLYRIISEACGNAVRHGECHVIDLRLYLVDEKTVLVIQDDGIGINSQSNDR